MAELHESVCVLAQTGRRRDAVILGRTLCEAAIVIRWLTNHDDDDRLDRYVGFGGQVLRKLIAGAEKYMGYKDSPPEWVERVIKESAKLFKEGASQWSVEGIRKMAEETDFHERSPDGKPVNLDPQHGVSYFLFSLHSHPTIWTIQNFLPAHGEALKSLSQSSGYRDIAELVAVRFCTVWLYYVGARVNLVLRLRKDKQLSQIWEEIKTAK